LDISFNFGFNMRWMELDGVEVGRWLRGKGRKRIWGRDWWGARRDTECMVKSVEGIYRNGKVEVVEHLAAAEGSRVIVTWIILPSPWICGSEGLTKLKRPIYADG
jgi:hypothetical protein